MSVMLPQQKGLETWKTTERLNVKNIEETKILPGNTPRDLQMEVIGPKLGMKAMKYSKGTEER